MKTVVFHSYKGGTGKTTLATNTAIHLAQEHKVTLVDFDLRAPSLGAYFKLDPEIKPFSDYLLGEVSIEETMQSIPNINGNLQVAFSSLDFLRKESEKRGMLVQRNDAILNRLFDATRKLEEKCDLLLIDSMPGVSYRALDALLVADRIIVATRPMKSDVTGLSRLLVEIYQPLREDATVGLVVNQVEDRTSPSSSSKRDADVIEAALSEIQELATSAGVEILGTIPRIPLVTERLYPLEEPTHPICPYLKTLAEKVFVGW